MNKQQFLNELKRKLSGIPQDNVDEQLAYYIELIDDYVEDGMTEEAAVKEMGSIDEIASRTVSEIPLTTLVKERVKPNRALRVWEVLLLILGSPVWLPILICLTAVFISVYVVLWDMIIVLWAMILVFTAGSIGGIAASILSFGVGFPIAAAFIGFALFCAGLLIVWVYVCVKASCGLVLLTKKFALWVKSWFIRKEKTR